MTAASWLDDDRRLDELKQEMVRMEAEVRATLRRLEAIEREVAVILARATGRLP